MTHLSLSQIRVHALAWTLVAAGLGTSLVLGLNSHAQNANRQSPVPQEVLKHAFDLSSAFRAASKAVSPSVVNIRSTQRVESPLLGGNVPRGQSPFEDDFFRRFFDLPDDSGVQPDVPNMPRERVGQGSGVIVRADGYILTNNHVVEDATEIKVQITGGEEYTATVVGTDPETDVAVVKIDASGLTPAVLGDSDALEVGDWVLAIGSPFGYDHTVTAGIVSAKGRQVGIIRDARGFTGFEDFIQTDASINPGNSGGPLVNLYGEVVGLNTAISSRTGVNAGVGFAIPSNLLKPVMNSLIETGSVRRGALGIGIQPLTPELSNYLGYQGTNGVVVNQVYRNSGADKAGIRVNDIITKIDGKPANDTQSLMTAVAQHAPGDTIQLEIFRNGRTLTKQVTLGDRAAQFNLGQPSRGGESSGPASARNLGMSVQELTPELADQLNAEGRTGVVVARVLPDSLAGKAGIARGDIISRIDNTDINTVEDFNAAIEKADASRGVALQVFRNGAARIVILKSGSNRPQTG